MKAILALLLGLLSQSFADDDSVLLELESPDSDEVSVGDDVQSYGGLIIQVRQDIDGAPTIALGSEIDDYADVYCLNFLGLFEASEYDTSTSTSAAYTAIDGTTVDLANANCTTRAEGSTATASVFSIRCTDVGEATLTLTFTFIQDSAGDYGLEYIINLRDYELSDPSAKLVMVQSLEECGDVIDLDIDEVDEEDVTSSTETPEPTETDEPEETDEPSTTDDSNRRRRLLQTEEPETSETPEPTETDEPEETDVEDVEETEDGEDTEDSENEEDTSTETETDESTDESTDAESLEEEDGISEDDSGEFDTGFARFVVNGQALDVCDGVETEINSTLVYQPDDGELHIVFDSFECTLVLDPFYGLDNSKYELQYGDTTPGTTEDNAGSIGIMIAMISGLFVWLW